MSKDPHIANIFSAENEPCLGLEEMNAFLSGQLAATDKHRVERHVLNCELCAIALESLEEEGFEQLEKGAQAVAEMAWDRAAAQNKKKRRGAIFWISAAASVAILITVGALLNQGPSDKAYEQAFAEAIQQTSPLLPSEELTSADEQESEQEQKNMEAPADIAQNSTSSNVTLGNYKDSNSQTKGMGATWMADSEEPAKEKIAFREGKDFSPKAPGMRPISPAVDEIVMTEEEAAEDFSDDDLSEKTLSNGGDKAFVSAPPLSRTEPGFTGIATDSMVANGNGIVNIQQNTNTYAWNSTPNGSNTRFKTTDNKKFEKQKSSKPQLAGKTMTAAKEDAVAASPDFGNEESIALKDRMETRSATTIEQKPNDMDEGLLSYREGRYADAAARLRKATEATPDNLQAHVLAADAFLRINQPQAALYHAERVLAQPGNSYYEDAQWYKALALISLKEGKKAKELLTTIKDGKGKNADKAAKALQNLD